MNNRVRQRINFILKNSLNAILLVLLLFFTDSCIEEHKSKSTEVKTTPKRDSTQVLTDSINVALRTDKPGLIFNIHTDIGLDAYALEYKNLSSNDTLINRKIKRLPYPQVIVNLRFIPGIGNVRKMYLLEDTVTDLKLKKIMDS